MPKSIAETLDRLALGETATLRGARVTRRSLLGFELDGARRLLDAAEVEARLSAPARAAPVRITVCRRCAGDGLGRRKRGKCGLCHGPGVLVTEPLAGWDDAAPGELTSARDQARAALGAARPARARESLLALLDHLATLGAAA